jgi:acyl-CoA thioester hydrolase
MPDMPITYRGVVHPWHCDIMGHMNVTFYVSKFDEASWSLFTNLGLTAAYLKENNRGIAAVQQNTTYKAEVLAGETVTIRSGLIEVREKVLRYVHEMRRDADGKMAAFMVLTAVHIDTRLRKSCPLPPDLLAECRKQVVAYDLPV